MRPVLLALAAALLLGVAVPAAGQAAGKPVSFEDARRAARAAVGAPWVLESCTRSFSGRRIACDLYRDRAHRRLSRQAVVTRPRARLRVRVSRPRTVCRTLPAARDRCAFRLPRREGNAGPGGQVPLRVFAQRAKPAAG
jgi:hypothetical protein